LIAERGISFEEIVKYVAGHFTGSDFSKP